MQSNKIRSSSLPLALRCPASTLTPDIRIEGDRGAADLGTAAHDVVLRRIKGEDVEISDVACRLRVDADELGILVALAFKCWHKIRDHFPDPQIEVPFSWTSDAGLTLTGHADMVSVAGNEVRVADLKTGRVDSDYSEQLKAYMYLALQEHPECDTAYAAVIWVREQRQEADRFTRVQLERWFEQAETTLSEVDLFSPGSHCGYCRRKYECPAFDLMFRKSMELVADGKVPETGEPRGISVGDLYHAAKMVEKECKTARDLIRAEVEVVGGTLQIGAGKQLQLIDQEQDQISYTAARKMIEEAVPDADLDEIFSIGKGAFTDAVKETAPPRQKGKYIEQAMERLREAGAVTKKTVTKLEERRCDNATTELTGVDAILGYKRDAIVDPK